MDGQSETDQSRDVPRGLPKRGTLLDWLEPQARPWSLQHVRELMPTVLIERPSRTLPLPAHPVDLDRVTTSRGETLEDYFQDTATQGWIVLRGGRVVYEKYLGSLTPTTRHSLMSVTKSFTSSIAGVLVGQGRLHPEDLLTSLMPELIGTGWEGLRVRHLLDMRGGLDYTEPGSYPHDDPAAKEYERVYQWAPGEPQHRSSLDYMRSLRAGSGPGSSFAYQSILTDMLGWVVETVTGQRLATLIETLIWEPIGAEQDAEISVDRFGNAMADGGMSATLRDIARFGELWRNHGVADGRQVIPESWVLDTLAPGEDSQAAFAPGASIRASSPYYRNNWWVVDATVPFYAARGFLGQSIYVHEAAELVVASFASWAAETPVHVSRAVDAVQAIARHLS